MQKILFLLTTALLLLSIGCKKDEVRATLHAPSSVKGFTTTSNQIVLTTANDSVTVTKFSWGAADYGYAAAVAYTLLFDLPSDTSGPAAWANAWKVPIATDSLSKSWLGTDFNHIFNQLGLDPGVASTVVVRLKMDVNQGTGAVSTVPSIVGDLSIQVTPYHVLLVYPKLYVAGDFLNPTWTQKDQAGWILACTKNNGVFEGFVNFPNAGNNFKLTPEPDWNGIIYGWGTSGTTISKGGGNLWNSGPAYYRISADTNNLTISYDATQWRLAGDFNGWSLSATPMTFDAGTNLWTATGVSMTTGDTYKFEGNGNWTAEFGLDSKGNFVLGGGNITATKTGVFTVTLDLSQGLGNYTFSVK